MNNEKVKNGQVKEVEKAKLGLEKVAPELMSKLSKEALDSIKSSLTDIRKLVDDLEDAANQALEA